MRIRGLFIALLAVLALVLILSRPRNSTVGASAVSKEVSATKGGTEISEPTMRLQPTRDQRRAELVAEIEKAITSEDDVQRERVFQGLLASLVELDPLGAAALLARIDPGPLRDEYLLRFAQLWAARDSSAALQWGSTLQDQIERITALRTISVEIAQADPEAAIWTMESMGVPDENGTLDNMAQLWAGKDISAATAWALARPEGQQRDGFLARIAYVLANQNPSEAATLVVKNIGPGELQTEAAISVVHRWALQDWNSAREWVDLFPQGPLRDRAHNELAGIKARTVQ